MAPSPFSSVRQHKRTVWQLTQREKDRDREIHREDADRITLLPLRRGKSGASLSGSSRSHSFMMAAVVAGLFQQRTLPSPLLVLASTASRQTRLALLHLKIRLSQGKICVVVGGTSSLEERETRTVKKKKKWRKKKKSRKMEEKKKRMEDMLMK